MSFNDLPKTIKEEIFDQLSIEEKKCLKDWNVVMEK